MIRVSCEGNSESRKVAKWDGYKQVKRADRDLAKEEESMNQRGDTLWPQRGVRHRSGAGGKSGNAAA